MFFSCRFCQKLINGVKLDIDDELATLFLEVTGTRLNTHRKLSLVSCEICEKSLQLFRAMKVQFVKDQFEQTTHLDVEEASANESTAEELECEQCQQKFTTNFALKMHRRKHSSEKSLEPDNFRCVYCRINFDSFASFREHKRLIHSKRENKEVSKNVEPNDQQKKLQKVGKKEYYCEKCDQEFLTGGGYSSHMSSLKHRDEKIPDETPNEPTHALKCRYCDMIYSSPSSLRRHKEAVHKLKRFKCKVLNCQKVLFDMDEVISHLTQVHKGISRSQKFAYIAAFNAINADENNTSINSTRDYEEIVIPEDQDTKEKLSGAEDDNDLFDENESFSDWLIERRPGRSNNSTI